MTTFHASIYQYNSEVAENSNAGALKQIWLVFVVFLYLYNFPLNYFHIPFSSSKLVTVFAVMQFVLHPKLVSKLLKNKYYFVLLVLTLFTLAYMYLFQCVVHASFVYYKYPYVVSLLYIDCFIGAVYIISLIKQYSIKLIINILVWVCLIQSLLMTLAIGSLEIKQFVFQVLDAGPGAKGHDFSLEGLVFRGIALASDRKIGLGSLHAIVCNLILFVLMQKKNGGSLPQILGYGFAFLVIALGGMLGSRTFFVAFLTIFVIFILLKLSAGKFFKFLKFILIISATFSLLIAFIVNSINDRDIQKRLEYFQEWAFEFYYNYERSGEISTESSDDLLERHYKVIPQDLSTWLIGDSNRTPQDGTPVQGSDTDSGYLLTIYYVGILGSIGIYLYWPVFGFMISRLFSKEERISRFIWAIIIFLFILHFKLEALIGSFTIVKIIFLLFVFGVERRYVLRSRDEDNETAYEFG